MLSYWICEANFVFHVRSSANVCEMVPTLHDRQSTDSALRYYAAPGTTWPDKVCMSGKWCCRAASRTAHPLQNLEELRKRDRRSLRSLNHRLAVRTQRRHRERHGDAVIAKRIQLSGAELLPPFNDQAIPRLFQPHPHATQVLRYGGDAVRLLDTQFARIADGEPLLAGRAQHRQNLDLVNQRRCG